MRIYFMVIILTACLVTVYCGVAGRLEGRSRRYNKRGDVTPFIACNASSECPGRMCCRNEAGNPVNNENMENMFMDGLLSETGRCSPRPSGPGQACTPERCQCQQGYECYRPVTGVCCAPYTCWTVEDAQRDREYWQNCTPPDCFLPP